MRGEILDHIPFIFWIAWAIFDIWDVWTHDIYCLIHLPYDMPIYP